LNPALVVKTALNLVPGQNGQSGTNVQQHVDPPQFVLASGNKNQNSEEHHVPETQQKQKIVNHHVIANGHLGINGLTVHAMVLQLEHVNLPMQQMEEKLAHPNLPKNQRPVKNVLNHVNGMNGLRGPHANAMENPSVNVQKHLQLALDLIA
jgi:hypothetical protein